MIIFLYSFFTLFFLIVYFTIFFGSKNMGKDFTNPLSIFILYFPLTYFGLPVVQMITDGFRYKHSYSEFAHFVAAVYSLIFILFVFLSYTIATNKMDKRKVYDIFNVKEWYQVEKNTKNILRITILIPCLLVIIYFYKYILSFGYEQYLANRIILLSGKGYLTSLLLWLIPYFIYELVNIYAEKQKYHKRINKRFILILLTIAITPGIILGSRTNLLLPFLFIILSITVLKYKGLLIDSWKIIKVLFPVLLVIITGLWLEGYRQSLMVGESVESAKIIKQISGGFGTAENLYWWLDFSQGKLFYGTTLIAIIVGFIPRAIWIEKPYGGGPALVNTMYPGRYDQGGSNITSYTTGFPFEFMMNFGFAGSIIGGIIFGLILALIYWYRSKIRDVLHFVIWLMLMYCAFTLLHGEIFGVTTKLVGLVFPLLLVQLVKKMFTKEVKNESQAK